MSSAAMEDKKTVAMHEGTARELQAKINALLTVEKVGAPPSLVHLSQPLDRMSAAVLSNFKQSKRKLLLSTLQRKSLPNLKITYTTKPLTEMSSDYDKR